MKKRILGSLLALCMICALLPLSTLAVDSASLSISSAPMKKMYTMGEGLNLDGIKLSYTEAGKSMDLVSTSEGLSFAISGQEVGTGAVFSTVGKYTVDVSYKTAKASFALEVSEKKEGLTLTAPTKMDYKSGETFSTTGFAAIYMEDGKESKIAASQVTFKDATGLTISTRDKFVKEGSYQIFVTYKNAVSDFTVKVTEPVRTLTLTTAPTKSAYQLNETFNTEGFAAVYAVDGVEMKLNNKSTGLTFTDATGQKINTNFVFKTAGSYVINANYEGMTAPFTLTVGDVTKTFSMLRNPKMVYAVGESFNTMGFIGSYDIGGIKTAISAEMVSFRDAAGAEMKATTVFTQAGNYTVTVSYQGIDLSYAIVVYGSRMAEAMPSNTKLMIGGVATNADAYLINDNNYIKLRDLATLINKTDKNFEVTYNNANSTIELKSKTPYTSVGGELTMGAGKTMTATMTNSKIFIDGKEVNLTAYLIGDNNYFKLRDVMQAFDVFVGYDMATSSASIDTTKSYELPSTSVGTGK